MEQPYKDDLTVIIRSNKDVLDAADSLRCMTRRTVNWRGGISPQEVVFVFPVYNKQLEFIIRMWLATAIVAELIEGFEILRGKDKVDTH